MDIICSGLAILLVYLTLIHIIMCNSPIGKCFSYVWDIRNHVFDQKENVQHKQKELLEFMAFILQIFKVCPIDISRQSNIPQVNAFILMFETIHGLPHTTPTSKIKIQDMDAISK